jgi:hypothetical protein
VERGRMQTVERAIREDYGRVLAWLVEHAA